MTQNTQTNDSMITRMRASIDKLEALIHPQPETPDTEPPDIKALFEAMKTSLPDMVEKLSVAGVQLTQIRSDYQKTYENLCRASATTMEEAAVLEFSYAVTEINKNTEVIVQTIEMIEQITRATNQLVKGAELIP